jgi:NMD protein affecting ribosome stability and mRNA decay
MTGGMREVRTILKLLNSRRVCRWCGKEKDSFYGDMCTDCMGQ